MLRSLYAGISGMKANQTKLDVIGNNIANVGTTAFKSSRVRFQDMLNQNVKSALAPGLNQGGINPSTVGLGVKIAGIDSIVSQGNMQATSRNLDVAVDGEGFFMVSKGQTVYSPNAIDVADGQLTVTPGVADVFYTRDGSFTLDSEGNLLNSDGLRVLGYAVSGMGMKDSDGNIEAVASSLDETNGDVYFVDADSVEDITASPLVPNLRATEDLKTLKIPDEVITDGTTTPPTTVRIISFSIEKDGLIKAVCEGGKVTVLGQIAMASFKNPGGLEKEGSNLYRNSSNSGVPAIRAGYDATATEAEGGYGDINQGMLEMSNVDLAEQFTDMIVATRAFQASSKMINNGDEILQEIINLKR